MDLLDLVGLVLGALGIFVPIGAALYEFVLFGRKRLGYRVQMDTPVTDELQLNLAGPLQELKIEGQDLDHPSVVLLRIENAGSAAIGPQDYAVLQDDPIGLRVSFPQRRVCGIAVTEFNDDDGHLAHCFGEDSGLGITDGVIELPRVPLNRGDHYKVLVVLERAPGATDGSEPPKPRVEGGVIGSVRRRRRRDRGRVRETESNTTGLSRRLTVAVFAFVFVVSVTQLGLALAEEEVGAPLDCEKGDLTLVGSTAFKPVLEAAEKSYEDRCPGARIRVQAEGSDEGLRALDAEGDGHDGDVVSDMLAFSDGPKDEIYTQLSQRPIALILFAVVADKDVGVDDLSKSLIQDIWSGDIVRWDDDRLDGADLDIHAVSRESSSGTQRVFRKQILGDLWVEEESSENCVEDDANAGHISCRVGSTSEMLDTVAEIDGAIGYAELGAVRARDDVKIITIDGAEAKLKEAEAGAYPFWATEYAYSYGKLSPETLASSFLRFLTEQIGEDLVRFHGHRPCDDMVNEVLCQPTSTPAPTP